MSRVSELERPVEAICGSYRDPRCEYFDGSWGVPVLRRIVPPNAWMHGTVCANYAVDKSDLLLAFGVRFDDRVTGKLEAFASRAKIVHIDIDSAEIGKNKQPHVSVCADVNLEEELKEQKVKFPLSYKTFGEAIPPQYAIQVLDELTDGNAIISTGVGQHQMWAAQFYKYRRPRQWLTSGGLGAMGFGLPAAIGAAVANPDAIVVDIDGDGSFMMNVQELATIRVENLPIKIMLLNNQHLGMVVQWEDRFYKANRAHTYLGNPSNESEIFPNMLKFAAACGIPAARVTKKEHLKEAIQKMLDTPGPYLLDVIVPHQEHVLPMIPSGGAFKDVITEVLISWTPVVQEIYGHSSLDVNSTVDLNRCCWYGYR
ncbi:chlorsulfuron/imidazolinone resistant 1 [Prunus dulcis]|uniref:Chlorsulfuron/imidazolinone resistant 1 n=1 Tax=Prunus dulcis TaxID=3755 RepID=A0A4Y1RWB2_PRUDU|nr:chlorsulfuron/imidazolinone resistant 1 [Prunus dulcis]